MIRLGFKSVVYHGELRLGELDTVPIAGRNFHFPNSEIRIHHISPPSERCPPLSILQAISPFSVRCKLQSSSPFEQPHLINLHASCFYELKTAVVLLGDEEIHLIAMPSKKKKYPCFWCYSVPLGLYTASLGMLNLRCLAIVFDLDETLIVANTMKSFEDRIEALRGWLVRETDPARKLGMSAELKRYVDDRALLKQYMDNDSIKDSGDEFKVLNEEVPPLSDNHEKVFRPVIRLQEKKIILTRINPEIRDTSVLVRLRPAWDDLRSYLTAKGRKRFEVYVCTMAERDYALEMWRLLDPESHLIASKELLDRVICVKSGSRKSLINVFQDGTFHPKMAMVIDDRLKVWEDKDQPRVHVVPAFTPYYAPQAETANAVPILCVARNVACNVRGCFFKEFDENLLQRTSELFYEDEVVNLPPAPDTSNYLMSEDAGFVPNGNPIAEGINGAEDERRPNQWICAGHELQRQNFPPANQPLEVGVSQNQVSSYSRETQLEAGKVNLLSSLSIGVLQEIGRRCSSKVEFRSVLSTSKDLQFSVEVLFAGEKIGVGMGKTRKDAQQEAAEKALHSLAEKYVAYISPFSGATDRDFDKFSLGNENGFLWDIVSAGSNEVLREDGLPKESAPEVGTSDNGSSR